MTLKQYDRLKLEAWTCWYDSSAYFDFSVPEDTVKIILTDSGTRKHIYNTFFIIHTTNVLLCLIQNTGKYVYSGGCYNDVFH
jgi:hypothetical protein